MDDVLEKLIKALEIAKEELTKNINCAPGTDPNMDKADIVRPDAGYGKVTVKDTAPKPKNPNEPYGKITFKNDEDHPATLSESDVKKLIKEELTCSANGQWNLKKDAANPALAPKDKKVKMLQQQIDSGTYKPDPKKIAGAMLKKEEPHKDDPKHEEKEQKIASKIKDKADDLLDMHKEELACSENGQWKLMEKSVYNAGTHPMKGRESKVGNFPHYEYDTSASTADNTNQAKAHFDKHKIKLSDAQLQTHLINSKRKAKAEER